MNFITFLDCRRDTFLFLLSSAEQKRLVPPHLITQRTPKYQLPSLNTPALAGAAIYRSKHPFLSNSSSSAFLLTLFRAASLMNCSVIHPMLIRGWCKNTLLKTLNSIKIQHYQVPSVCIKPPIWNQHDSSWTVMNKIQLLNQ